MTDNTITIEHWLFTLTEIPDSSLTLKFTEAGEQILHHMQSSVISHLPPSMKTRYALYRFLRDRLIDAAMDDHLFDFLDRGLDPFWPWQLGHRPKPTD